MPTDVYDEQLKAFKADNRTTCQFGLKCYQKNPAHHSRYKHPPKKQQIPIETKIEETVVTGKKRTNSESDGATSGATNLPQTKVRKADEVSVEGGHNLSPSPPSVVDKPNPEAENDDSKPSSNEDSLPEKDLTISTANGNTTAKTSETMIKEDKMEEEKTKENKEGKMEEKEKEKMEDEAEDNITLDTPSIDPKTIISDLFLVEMPDDFYKFYDFCKSLSSKDPSTALKLVDLKLVGPYDVLGGKIKTNHPKEPEKYLRHWRYYYDPPEFQTILKGNDKDGLHYGYWRDTVEDKPIFVAKNNANKDCSIIPVAANIFGAVNKHIEERVKTANPFEKGPLAKLSKDLKTFAKENDITLDNDNSEMRNRARQVVAKTFHGAGIVVPYDKKTQLGYRDLSATDSQLKKILQKIDEAETDDERKSAMSSIEEVVRLATIAADESDFGTCLELGHDLFSSGITHVQRTALGMLAAAYNLLNRQKFLKIAEAHATDRKKGCDLGVL